MSVNKLSILVADIETLPGDAHFFDPKIRFLSHKMVEKNPIMVTWSGQVFQVGEKPSKVVGDFLTPKEVRAWDDKRITDSLVKLVHSVDIVLGHNAERFDVNKLRGRAWANRGKALGPIRVIDTLKIAKDFGLPHNNLDALLKIQGLGTKDKTDIDWWLDIKRLARAGDDKKAAAAIAKMYRYNQNDVRQTTRLFAETMFEHARKLPRLVDSQGLECLYCGRSGTLNKRGKKRTNAYTYQRYYCHPGKGGCGRYPRYKTHDGSNTSPLRPSAGV
jgi:hypothetical protein